MKWQGKLNLEYQYCQDRTKIIHVENIAPLKVQRPFYPEGTKTCHTIILNTAGGIVGSDKLEQNIYLHPGANVLITTASAGKIYRSQGDLAQQQINITIESGGCLEFLPQENIIFAGADYYQNLKVKLAPAAHWLGWEINRFGRSARGEIFFTGTWLGSTEIWREGKPLWIDKQGLWGEENLFESPNGLGNKPLVGTLSWISAPVESTVIAAIKNLGDNLVKEGEMGVTELLSGLVCRYRGNSTLEVKTWFKEIWSLLRLKYLNKSACQMRIW
ncbi:urease accessory protein UreD [Gloeocapsa sp. PCC 73106]|uniref:urease accessory protein UreD n=1 Tax=Gloeocapsa sp. PCC 73106 TaxID=102232 RepID=UPI0002AC794A|nr:urease accessory protein UreD [Gloeocapsa sp. PCC 73106]ELR97970.1 urease accessory protein UreH [Gloeocapsa sp. PCC 73106]